MATEGSSQKTIDSAHQLTNTIVAEFEDSISLIQKPTIGHDQEPVVSYFHLCPYSPSLSFSSNTYSNRLLHLNSACILRALIAVTFPAHCSLRDSTVLTVGMIGDLHKSGSSSLYNIPNGSIHPSWVEIFSKHFKPLLIYVLPSK
jgi:hypothetical protein